MVTQKEFAIFELFNSITSLELAGTLSFKELQSMPQCPSGELVMSDISQGSVLRLAQINIVGDT